jgi:hypothetical protein
MIKHGPIGRREQPCPEDDTSLEEAIREQLDELDPDIVAAYAEFAADKVEIPVEMAASLILEMGLKWRWGSTQSVIAQRNPGLALALNDIVYAIGKLQKAFIEHRARSLRRKAEEIDVEAAA